jgi:tetratricopeptide (TPR) repeat protein
VLAARIDRLAEDDRRLLQTAAVIGHDVPLALLEAVSGMAGDDLGRTLGRLQTVEFLYETRSFPDVEYAFKHALTHDVAYQSLLHERRRALHARIGTAMEALHAGRLIEHVERLAHHALAAEQWGQALTYARMAGAKALGHSAYRDAVDYFEQARSALARLPADRATSEAGIDLCFDLRTALTPLGEHDQIAEHLREAEASAQKLGDDRRLGRVSAYLADYFRQGGEHERAIAAGERALAIARRLGDLTLEVASNTYLGHACQNTGHYRRAITLFRRNAELTAGDLARETFGLPFVSSVQSRAWLAGCLNELGEFAEGMELAEQAIAIAERVDHPASLATACSVLGNLHLRMDEAARALPFLERGHALSQAGHLNIWLPNAESWLGLACMRLGRVDEGLRLLHSAVERERSMRRLAHHSLRLTALADGYLRLGRMGDAERHAIQALDLARKGRERGNEAHALRLLGDIAARSSGSPATDGLESSYRQSLGLAEELEMRPVAAQCHLGLAAAARASQHLDVARRHLAAALTLYRAMGATALLRAAEAEQARLG